MEDQDLLEIGILNSGHRQRILQAIQLLPKVSNALLASPSRQSQWFTSRYSSSVTISDIPTYWCNSPKEVFVGSAKQSDSQDCYGPYSAFDLLKGCDAGNTTGPEGSFRVSLPWESLYQYKCHSRPRRWQLRCKKTRPTLGEYGDVPGLVASCSIRDNISCNNSIGLASRDKDPAYLQVFKWRSPKYGIPVRYLRSSCIHPPSPDTVCQPGIILTLSSMLPGNKNWASVSR